MTVKKNKDKETVSASLLRYMYGGKGRYLTDKTIAGWFLSQVGWVERGGMGAVRLGLGPGRSGHG